MYMIQADTRNVLKKTARDLLPMAVGGAHTGSAVATHMPSVQGGVAQAGKRGGSPHDWTIDQVLSWLEHLSLPQYVPSRANACSLMTARVTSRCSGTSIASEMLL